jgi:hypothetical protein
MDGAAGVASHLFAGNVRHRAPSIQEAGSPTAMVDSISVKP